MRKGIALFLAGIGLLCAGIVATSDEFWGSPQTEVTIPVDLAGVDAVDLTGGRIEKIVFSDTHAPELRFKVLPYMADKSQKAKKPVIARTGSTLRITSPDDFFSFESTLTLPPHIGKVMARNIKFEGKARVPVLVVESTGDVGWNANADSVSFIDVSKENPQRKDGCECQKASFSIDGGSIGLLTITSEKGGIELGDIANVGTIHLKTGPEASLKLDHVADLARVSMEKLGEKPETPTNP